jgi:folate-dependent phosphoribosylglycinamide formyltransferase PurN
MEHPLPDLDGKGQAGSRGDVRPPLRVGVLCSRRAPGLEHLLDRDRNHGVLYRVVCCLTTEDAFANEACTASHGIAVIRHPIRRFCGTRGRGAFDLTSRPAYDAASVERLAPYRLDVIVLAGYLYLLTEPMLSYYRHQIINVHHSDLTDRGEDGRTRFPGLRAVRDAIRAGARETRATVHLVTSELDEGPPVLRSWPFPVSALARDALAWNAPDVLGAYTCAHQEWMIRSTWGPLLAAVLALIATGHLDLTVLGRATTGRPRPPWDLAPSGMIHGEGPMAIEGRLVAEIS